MLKDYFIYNNEKYQINRDIFNMHSDFFLNEANKNEDYLISEFDNLSVSEESVNTFINYCQNFPFNITSENALSVQYLAKKYNVLDLINETQIFLNKNINLVIDSLFKLNKFDSQAEIIIAQHFMNLINDDRLLTIPIQNFYRIFQLFLNENKDFSDKIHELIDFVLNYIEIRGQSASVLLQLIDSNSNIGEILNIELINHRKLIEYPIIQSKIIENLLFNEEKNKEKHSKEITMMKENYEAKLLQMENNFSNKIDNILEQMENDFSSKIENICEQMDNKFQQMDNKFSNKIENICEQMDNNSKQMENKSKQMENNFSNKIENIREQMDNKFQQMENKFSNKIENICEQMENKSKQIENNFSNKIEKLTNENQILQKIIIAVLHLQKQADKNIEKSIKSIDQFNQLNGEYQAGIMAINNFVEPKPITNEINKLLFSLINDKEKFENDSDKSSFIYIEPLEKGKKLNKINKLDKIFINYSTMEFLNQTNLLNLNYFNLINNQNYYIELQYPSDNLQSVYDSIIRIFKENGFSIKMRLTLLGFENGEEEEEEEEEEYEQIINDDRYINSILVKNNIKSSVFLSNLLKNLLELEEIAILPSVNMIESYTFSDCNKLKLITVDPYNTIIRPKSFYNCLSPKNIKITTQNTNINEKVMKRLFKGIPNINEITLPKSINCISSKSFSGFSSLENIVIPSTITTIQDFAFEGCKNLKKITIDPYRTQIQNNSFNNCTSPKHIIVSTKNTAIDNYIIKQLFEQIQNITKITISESVTSIPSKAFYGLTSLESVILPPRINSIESFTFFNCNSLNEITIPPLVESIGSWSFAGCTSLKMIEIPSNVKNIESSAFYKCTSMSTIIIPSSVEWIGNNVFNQCTSLKKMKIPFLKIIEPEVFLGCSSLEEIIIPSSVKQISNFVFHGCVKLRKITIDPYETQIQSNAFDDDDEVPKQVTISTNSIIVIDHKIIKRLTRDIPNIKEIIITKPVKSIESKAFAGLSSLISITLPASLTSIGSFAFDNCSSLTSINIPNSVVSIGTSIFSKCTSLKEITFPPSIKKEDLF